MVRRARSLADNCDSGVNFRAGIEPHPDRSPPDVSSSPVWSGFSGAARRIAAPPHEHSKSYATSTLTELAQDKSSNAVLSGGFAQAAIRRREARSAAHAPTPVREHRSDPRFRAWLGSHFSSSPRKRLALVSFFVVPAKALGTGLISRRPRESGDLGTNRRGVLGSRVRDAFAGMTEFSRRRNDETSPERFREGRLRQRRGRAVIAA